MSIKRDDLSRKTSVVKALVAIAAVSAVGLGFAIVRTSLRTEIAVPASPVPIRPASNGRLAYLSGTGAGTIFGLSRVVVVSADGSDRQALSAEGT